MLAVQSRQEELAQLEYRLRSQAIRENRDMDELIQDAVALYLKNPQSARAARASFQQLLKDPPLRCEPEMVAQCMDEDYYSQRTASFYRDSP